jgi:hypothetical protein
MTEHARKFSPIQRLKSTPVFLPIGLFGVLTLGAVLIVLNS